MERSAVVTNFRTQLVVVNAGVAQDAERAAVWPEPAEEFLRRIHKLGVELVLIGPKPNQRFGTKRTIKFLDRHEVVSLKELAASKSHSLEFRVLNRRNRSWIRLRAEACLVVGNDGAWPAFFEGWNSPGVMTVHAYVRWANEFRWLPGRDLVFYGASNQSLRLATQALDRGAQNVYVLEPGMELKCWRAHRDRFLSRGGRVLLNHQIVRFAGGAAGGRELYARNESGTMIIPVDTVVFVPSAIEGLSRPEQMRRGLFYLQRRTALQEPYIDEERWLERVDWRELYWRAGKYLDVLDHHEAEGALKMLKEERRRLLRYRKPGQRAELLYSGKILARESSEKVQTSAGAPRKTVREKPVASLECLENIPCRACADACPENAISIVDLLDQPALIEDQCTGCGICVAACPAGAAVMIKESAVNQKVRLFLPDDTREMWRPQTGVQLLNRRGDSLSLARVVSSQSYEKSPHRVLEIEASNIHVWEGRAFKFQPSPGSENTLQQSPMQFKRGWVQLNGVKRLCPIDVPLTVSLWQIGQKRFEDAFFCPAGSCRMCRVKIDGKDRLACQSLVQTGQVIEFEAAPPAESPTCWACPCSRVKQEELDQMKSEKMPQKLIEELTGFALGTCHGKWCAQTPFRGFESSPWREFWVDDVIETGEG